MKHHKLWIRGREAIEELEEHKRNNNDTSPIHLIECPSLADVVFKTGTASLSHPGNAAFRDLLYVNHDEYFNSLSVLETKDTVFMIIQDVKRRQGRFLEWNNCGCWVVMEDEANIRRKVYNSLLYFKRSLNAKKNMQVSSCSTFMFERQDGKKRKRDLDGSERRGCVEACSFLVVNETADCE
jgi:hypothetical protein